ncbi:MAG: lysophospholipid acyltransferase family protein [Candidatus Tenebribacter burtonii]|nr:lysophospholipid acyltransferase family protein [Candidatus Tenebribacter burtonii]
MKLSGKISASIIHIFLRTICKVDSHELRKIPLKGPYIVAINHTNFLEVPMIFTHLQPRKTVGIAKKETWKGGLRKCLATKWEAIPIDREGLTIETFRRSRKALNDGYFLIIAPEGTRNIDGKLLQGKPGVISIALRSNVPIIPVAHFGGEDIINNLKSLKRTKFTFKVGTPIILHPESKADQDKRKYFTDQLMYRIAELLPQEYRGVYSNLKNIRNDEIIEVLLKG